MPFYNLSVIEEFPIRLVLMQWRSVQEIADSDLESINMVYDLILVELFLSNQPSLNNNSCIYTRFHKGRGGCDQLCISCSFPLTQRSIIISLDTPIKIAAEVGEGHYSPHNTPSAVKTEGKLQDTCCIIKEMWRITGDISKRG